ALEIAVEAERRLLQVHALDQPPGVGTVGLQQRTGADDGHRLLDRANLHLQVDAHRRVDRYLDAVANDPFEAAQFRDDAVDPVFQVREDVVAGVVAEGGVRDVGVDFGDGHGDARQHETGGVADVAEQRSFHRLRGGESGRSEDKQDNGPACCEVASTETAHRILLRVQARCARNPYPATIRRSSTVIADCGLRINAEFVIYSAFGNPHSTLAS